MVRFRVGSTKAGGSHRPPPPDYFARSTQIRVLMLVSALMLVLYLMWEARKPENWSWMWAGVPQHERTEFTNAADDTVNTRLLPKSPGEQRIPGTVFADSADFAADQNKKNTASEPEESALFRTRRDAWSRVIDDLDRSERWLLDKVLKASREGAQLRENDCELWGSVLDDLTQQGDVFFEQATDSLRESGEDIPESEKKIWLQVLDDAETEWHQLVRVAFRAPLEGRPWTVLERRELGDLQDMLDAMDLQGIRDDTVWRGAEQHAWFRLVDKLSNPRGNAVDAAPDQTTGYLALFRQPEAYRGKLVRFRGTATLAYRVQAPENIHAVKEYFVFWLRPKGGPNSPLVVYALEAPPGFPNIKDKDLDRATTRMEEDVEVVGYLFKRWAYRAQDGLNTAPVLLAKRPLWLSAPVEMTPQPPPTFTTVALSILAVAGLAIGLASLAYWSNRTNPTIQRFIKEAENRTDPAPTLEDGLPSVRESLQRLANGEVESGESKKD